MQEEVGKRVFKNTIMLYIRMIFVVCVNLYISRLIMQALGMEDFGIYNIVGGIVLMFGFLNSSMAGSTSRFLTYELGRNDKDKLRKTFVSAIQIHVCLAILVLVLGESIGLWYVNSKLVIPESRIDACNIVYQFSLLSAIVSFVQVPYTAVVIAKERMNVYALIEILNVVLKLGIVFIVSCVEVDRLVLYSILLSILALFTLLIYFIYCRQNFSEFELDTRIDKETILPMLKFSGWDLYGNGCAIAKQQGLNLLINSFFGVVLNAAVGVALQASSAVSVFVSNLTMALRPPIIKKYACGDIGGLQSLLSISLTLCLFLSAIVCVPLYLKIDVLLGFWLVEVPPYATSFCKWLILVNVVEIINSLFIILIHATGQVKRISLFSGTIYLSTILFSYVAFMYSASPIVAYEILLCVTICVLISNIIITKKQINGLSLSFVFVKNLFPIVSVLLSFIAMCILDNMIENSFIGFLELVFSNLILLSFLFYTLWYIPKYGWRLRNILKI